ncbi:MAG: hypothetical protein OEW67_08010 [Cyclobacteriaceae bacterium]|nr:hypothetical protein [Cyclobacteriaceae bacterium]
MKKQLFNNLFLILVFMLVTKISISQTISLVEAPGMGKVRVITTFNITFVFENIELKDGVYYGVDRGDLVQIFPENISAIQLVQVQKPSGYKNKLFVSSGLVEFSYKKGDYATINIHYERQLNMYISGRFSYGTSFKSYGLISGDNNLVASLSTVAYRAPPSKQTFYSASLCFTSYFKSHENRSQLEVNLGYAVTDQDAYTYNTWNNNSYVKRRVYQGFELGVGYRLTKDHFIFRTGVSWPYGRYMSIGYAF